MSRSKVTPNRVDYLTLSPRTQDEIKTEFGIKRREFYEVISAMRREGLNVVVEEGKYHIQKAEEQKKTHSSSTSSNTIGEESEDLEERIEGYTRKELRAILKQFKFVPSKSKEYEIGDERVRIGIISDCHIGNKCFDPGLMNAAARTFKERDVKFVIDGGDTCDGFYRDRPGHVFELEQIGADEQVERAVQELSKLEKPIFGITGNHTTNAFFNTAGYDIGIRLQEKVPDFTYLGRGEGFIQLPHKNKIQIIHPDGGSAYAVSYRPQKIAESLEGGTKPNVLLIGHFHKAEYLFYRNIHIVQMATFEHQTPFMKGKNLAAMMGYWILDIEVGKSGVTRFIPEFYPGYYK